MIGGLERDSLETVRLRLRQTVEIAEPGVGHRPVGIDELGDALQAEIARDTGLPIVKRGDQATIDWWCERSDPVSVNLPTDTIARWKGQFS